VLLAGRTQATDPGTFGLGVLPADSDAVARAVVEGDPAVSDAVVRAALWLYRITALSRPDAFRTT